MRTAIADAPLQEALQRERRQGCLMRGILPCVAVHPEKTCGHGADSNPRRVQNMSGHRDRCRFAICTRDGDHDESAGGKTVAQCGGECLQPMPSKAKRMTVRQESPDASGDAHEPSISRAFAISSCICFVSASADGNFSIPRRNATTSSVTDAGDVGISLSITCASQLRVSPKVGRGP